MPKMKKRQLKILKNLRTHSKEIKKSKQKSRLPKMMSKKKEKINEFLSRKSLK
jgi:hypothetical protein